MTDKIFLALLEAQGAHGDLSRQGFQRLNLSEGQPKILYILLRIEGCVQKELADIAKVRPSTMTVLLDRMEKQGYIKREETKVSGGKRAYKVYLTEEGRVLANQVEELIEELEEQSFKGFSKEEREVLLSMLDRVTRNLIKYIHNRKGSNGEGKNKIR